MRLTCVCVCVCVCSFSAKVPLNMSTWVVSTHAQPTDAARAHDAAAIGIYGRDAVAHLNFPVTNYTLQQITAAMESLASRVRLDTHTHTHMLMYASMGPRC